MDMCYLNQYDSFLKKFAPLHTTIQKIGIKPTKPKTQRSSIHNPRKQHPNSKIKPNPKPKIQQILPRKSPPPNRIRDKTAPKRRIPIKPCLLFIRRQRPTKTPIQHKRHQRIRCPPRNRLHKLHNNTNIPTKRNRKNNERKFINKNK